MTPYYQDDLVTIYHGDMREMMSADADRPDRVRPASEGSDGQRQIPDNRLSSKPRPEGSADIISTDVIVTDPPYGYGYYDSDRVIEDLLVRLLAVTPNVAVFGYPELLVRLCIDAGQGPAEWAVWWPTNKNVSRGPKLPKESEHIAFFGLTADARGIMRPRSANATGRRIAISRGDDPNWARAGDVWRDPAPSGHFNSADRLHPNEKPVSLMLKVLQLMPGSVLDPFAGSGTTLVAAKSLGRRAVGIEIEERYCEIAATRCSQEVLGLEIPA